MASQTRQAREADRKLSVQTLVIASISSAAAAVIVSQFWKSGTAPAAAFTPVVVSVVSELLHKPTQAIKRVTVEKSAVLPEGAGAGSPAQKTREPVTVPAADTETAKPASDERPPPLRDGDDEAVPSDERATRAAPISYHKTGGNGGAPSRRPRKIHWKIVAATAALAFVIGAAILTVPEVIAGDSVSAKREGGTTIFGGGTPKTDSSNTEDSQDAQDQQNNSSDQNSGQSGGSSDQSKDSQDSNQTQQQKSTQTQTQKQPAPQQRQAPSGAKPAPAQPAQ
jgi:hypothetical protein